MRRSLIAAVAVTVLATPFALAATAGSAAAAPVPPRVPKSDFNHDGYADVVVSAPTATVGGRSEAGYVAVLYGSASGPDTAHPWIVSRSTEGIPGHAGESSYFGFGTSAGDFDGDGYTDLVVSSLGSAPDVLLWGSKDGLTGQSATALPEHGGRAGDFNGDGRTDLARSYSKEDPATGNYVAGIALDYGPFTRSGKPASQDSIPTDTDYYGPSGFIVGDMTGDGIDDLVTSHNFEEMAYNSRFWKGTRDGLSHTAKAIKSTAGGAIADLNGDGYGDLVARDNGSTNDDNESDKGTIRIEYGSADGPVSSRAKKITQDSAGVPGVGERGDQFGASLSAGDVNADGYADVAVGVPGEDLKVGSRNVTDAGSVVLLKGGANGVSGTGAQSFTQSTSGVPGVSEKSDAFGDHVLLRDTNGDKKADLLAAASLEDGTYTDSGAVWVLRGARGGLTTTGITSFGPAALGAPEKGAQLGYALGG